MRGPRKQHFGGIALLLQRQRRQQGLRPAGHRGGCGDVPVSRLPRNEARRAVQGEPPQDTPLAGGWNSRPCSSCKARGPCGFQLLLMYDRFHVRTEPVSQRLRIGPAPPDSLTRRIEGPLQSIHGHISHFRLPIAGTHCRVRKRAPLVADHNNPLAHSFGSLASCSRSGGTPACEPPSATNPANRNPSSRPRVSLRNQDPRNHPCGIPAFRPIPSKPPRSHEPGGFQRQPRCANAFDPPRFPAAGDPIDPLHVCRRAKSSGSKSGFPCGDPVATGREPPSRRPKTAVIG